MNIVPVNEFVSFLGEHYTEKALKYIKRKYKDDFVPIFVRYLTEKEYEDFKKNWKNCYNMFSFSIDDDKFPKKFMNVRYNTSSGFSLWLCNCEFQYDEDQEDYEENKDDEDYEVYDKLIEKNKTIITDD